MTLYVVEFNEKYKTYRIKRNSIGIIGVPYKEAFELADRLERDKEI